MTSFTVGSAAECYRTVTLPVLTTAKVGYRMTIIIIITPSTEWNSDPIKQAFRQTRRQNPDTDQLVLFRAVRVVLQRHLNHRNSDVMQSRAQ